MAVNIIVICSCLSRITLEVVTHYCLHDARIVITQEEKGGKNPSKAKKKKKENVETPDPGFEPGAFVYSCSDITIRTVRDENVDQTTPIPVDGQVSQLRPGLFPWENTHGYCAIVDRESGHSKDNPPLCPGPTGVLELSRRCFAGCWAGATCRRQTPDAHPPPEPSSSRVHELLNSTEREHLQSNAVIIIFCPPCQRCSPR